MKFSAVFVAAAALLCASVSAAQSDSVGAVKGEALVFDAPTSLRQASFVKGDVITHSRSEDLATSNVAVPDSSNPYIKVKGTGSSTGVVGVALSATDSSEDSSSSSTAWTTGLAVGGCAVAAVGIAGFVLMKKRQQRKTVEVDEEAQTPATGSPNDDLVVYKTDMETPVAV